MHLVKWLSKSTKSPFEKIYQSHFAMVHRRITYLTGDVHVAEELAQEVFIKLYKEPPSHDNIEAWLNVVAARTAYNHLKREKIYEQKLEWEGKQRAQETQTPESVVLQKEDQAMVWQALGTLSLRDRTCLLMKHSGYKYAEIADCLELEVGAIGVILSRAQEKFKKKYEMMMGGGEK